MTRRSPSTRTCSCASWRTTRSNRHRSELVTQEGLTVDIFYSIVKVFVQGGPFMIPILVAGAVGVAISVERYVSLTRMSVQNRKLWAEVEPVLTKGDFDKARELTGKDD